MLTNFLWHRKVYLIPILTCIFGFVAANQVRAKSPDNELVWKPKTKSVAVFKNGLAFFTQEGKTQLHQGWCYGRETPPAAFGTLAIYSTDPQYAVDIVGAGVGEVIDFSEVTPPANAASKVKQLGRFVGLSAKLNYQQDSTDQEKVGVLVGFSEEYAILKVGSQSIAIPIAGINRFQLSESPMRIHVADEKGKSPEHADIAMAYLGSGVVWIPEYTLKIVDDQFAELTLRGTLVNEAEDLVDCQVHFVVGVPHFVHSDLMSPLAVGRAIRSIGASVLGAANGVPQQVMSQMLNRAATLTNNTVAVNAAVPDPSSEAFADLLGNLPKLESSGAGDFTVYTKDKLTIRRGERTMVTLMTKRIRYGHRYRSEQDQPLKHFLTLENNTATAWTTGPCLAMSKTQALSEDLLKYTPIGSRGELQVTTAINVAQEVAEEESDRQLKAHEPTHDNFLDRVTVSGSISLKSFEKQPVEVVIAKPISGKPLIASDQGKLRTDASKLRLLERNGVVNWTLTLNPGESRTLTYRYERFVPSN